MMSASSPILRGLSSDALIYRPMLLSLQSAVKIIGGGIEREGEGMSKESSRYF